MVFQNYALYPHMTVFDNIAFGLKLRKYSEDEIKKRVEEAAQILGLTKFLQRKPASLLVANVNVLPSVVLSSVMLKFS